MDPIVAVWINLAITLGGVLMMIGAKRQQINDLVQGRKDMEEEIDRLKDSKLAVSDYRRERDDTYRYIIDVDKRAADSTSEVRGRVVRLEERAFGSGGQRR